MSKAASTLVLLLIDQHLAAWHVQPGDMPREQPIEGERAWFPCTHADPFVQGLDDISRRLGVKPGTGHQIELLYDEASRTLLNAALPKLAQRLTDCLWQIQRWEPLAERCGCSAKQQPDLDWVAQHALPLLLASDDASARAQMQQATQREHDKLIELLQGERSQLQRDNATLRAQNEALRRVDAERLIVFLPALFARVFTELGGQDLALLTGRPEPYALPNPYPEPSPETLQTLQRDFRALPHELQRQVVGFVTRLPQRQRLKPRPEMLELVLELESK